MSELIDRQALRAAHGLGADCHDCKQDMKSCQYDRDYSLMDFCEWLDDAPTASPWHRVEEELPKVGTNCLVGWKHDDGFYYEDSVYGYGADGLGFWCRKAEHDQMVEPDYWMPIEPPKEDE